MTDIAVQILQSELAEVEAFISEQVGDKLAKRDSLREAIKRLSRGSTNGAAKVAATIDDAALVAAVRDLTEDGTTDGVSSATIAKALGVDTRSIARKLGKLAQDGLIGGDREQGYAIA